MNRPGKPGGHEYLFPPYMGDEETAAQDPIPRRPLDLERDFETIKAILAQREGNLRVMLGGVLYLAACPDGATLTVQKVTDTGDEPWKSAAAVLGDHQKGARGKLLGVLAGPPPVRDMDMELALAEKETLRQQTLRTWHTIYQYLQTHVSGIFGKEKNWQRNSFTIHLPARAILKINAEWFVERLNELFSDLKPAGIERRGSQHMLMSSNLCESRAGYFADRDGTIDFLRQAVSDLGPITCERTDSTVLIDVDISIHPPKREITRFIIKIDF